MWDVRGGYGEGLVCTASSMSMAYISDPSKLIGLLGMVGAESSYQTGVVDLVSEGEDVGHP